MWATIAKKPSQIKPKLSQIVPTTIYVQTELVDDDEPKEFIPNKNMSLDQTKKDKIIKLRTKLNDDQKSLARKLCVEYADIRMAEQGKLVPLKVYNAICKYIEKNKTMLE